MAHLRDPLHASRLPPDDPIRATLHDEVHARPSFRIELPALVVYVAVHNDGVQRDHEWAHLRRLPDQDTLDLWALQGNFLALPLPQGQLKWERHTEFTRYTWVQPLDPGQHAQVLAGRATELLAIAPDWIGTIPGRTTAAIELVMLNADLAGAEVPVSEATAWFGERPVVGALMGRGGHSCVFADFRLMSNGFERMLVLAAPQTTSTRAGRIAQRLLEMETYRMMALRGLPVAKELGPVLGQAEAELAELTARLEGHGTSDQDHLDKLVALATRVERATATHSYRFAATRAYERLVSRRIEELREQPLPGAQTIGEFMQRRLTPAMATVAATADRLASLSERVARTSALLRTRVDIATETQNQILLEKLTRGQALQLQLQATVEGLSIAAISYYVISLLAYVAKALKAAGLPIHPEIAVGALTPVVLWSVWRATRHIHRRVSFGVGVGTAEDGPTRR